VPATKLRKSHEHLLQILTYRSGHVDTLESARSQAADYFSTVKAKKNQPDL